MATDLDVLGKLGDALKREQSTSKPDPWIGSRFQWLRHEPPPRKGAIGKEMFKRWAQLAGFDASPPPAPSESDYLVDGLPVIVKFGLRWANGTMVFEQIRNRGYAAGALLGLEPDNVHLWVVPRRVLWRASAEQHGPETRWLRIRPSQPPPVLAPFGDTLAAAEASLRLLLEEAGGKAGR
jgi:hypothetical protein